MKTKTDKATRVACVEKIARRLAEFYGSECFSSGSFAADKTRQIYMFLATELLQTVESFNE